MRLAHWNDKEPSDANKPESKNEICTFMFYYFPRITHTNIYTPKPVTLRN